MRHVNPRSPCHALPPSHATIPWLIVKRVLVVLFLGVLMAALDIAILGPVIPAIREAYSLGERGVSWVFTVWVLANLVGVPVMSKLADGFGRKRIYLLDIGLFGLGAGIVALSWSFPVLLVGRALQGFAVSGLFPVAGAFVGDSFPPERRGRAFGVLGSVFGVAFIIGPILAGILLLVGWRWVYAMFVPVSLLIAWFGMRNLPQTGTERGKTFDAAGLVALALVLLSLAAGISLDLPALVGAALVFLVLFVLAERRGERLGHDVILRLGLLRNRQVSIACVQAVGAGISEAAFIYFPTLAVLAFGVTKSEASFMLLPLMLAVALGSPLVGRLLDVWGSRRVVVACNVVLAAGMFCVSFAPGHKVWFYVGSVLIGTGLAGLMGSALSYILIHEARKAERAVSQGLITLFISVGQLITGAAVGAVAASMVDPISGYTAAFAGIGVLTLGMAGVGLLLKGAPAERAQLNRYTED